MKLKIQNESNISQCAPFIERIMIQKYCEVVKLENWSRIINLFYIIKLFIEAAK